MNITYGIIKQEFCMGADTRISYGIVAYDNVDESGTAIVIASVSDITQDRQTLLKLVMQCNKLKLSPIHLNDVIADFLES